MDKKRVLFISQEITPYLHETEISKKCRRLPQGIMEKGKDIRIFMPKYGCINERRKPTSRSYSIIWNEYDS